MINEAADGARQVIMRPENNDVFVRTGKQVIAACSLGISLDLWIDEINSMIEYVGDWTKSNSSSVNACYVERRPRCMMLFFVPKSSRFDFGLAGHLAELTTLLIKRFNVGMVECHQIPSGELERFLNPSMARQIYGEQPEHQDAESHRPMEA